jgi:hypothetical protein
MRNIGPEIQQKLKSVDRKLDAVIRAGTNKQVRIQSHTIESLMEDLSFIIGKLSSIYEYLAQTILSNTKDKD